MATCKVNNSNLWAHCLEDREKLDKQEARLANLEVGLKNAHSKIKSLEQSRDTTVNELAEINDAPKVEVSAVREMQEDIRVLQTKVSSVTLSSTQGIAAKVDTHEGKIEEMQDSLQAFQQTISTLHKQLNDSDYDVSGGESANSNDRNSNDSAVANRTPAPLTY